MSPEEGGEFVKGLRATFSAIAVMTAHSECCFAILKQTSFLFHHNQ